MLEREKLREARQLEHGPVPAGAERNFLAEVDLFQGVGNETLAALEFAGRHRRYASGEQVIDRDATSSDIYFVMHGRVRIVSYSMSGREIAFDELGPGAFFGELSAIDGKPRSAGAMAIDETILFSLPRRVFLSVLADYPDVAMKVMRRLARIVRAADERIMDLSTLAAHNRVHAELLRQARSSTRGRNTATIRPIPVHSDIASRVSTTRETVARVMGDLSRRGIVVRTADSLLIRNVDLLEDMVSEVRG